MDPLTTPPPLPETTPAAVRGLLQVLNTRANEHFAESLGSDEAAARYLQGAEVKSTTVDRERLMTLRGFIVDAIADPASAASWAGISVLADDAALRLTFSAPATARLVPSDDDVATELLARLNDAIASGDWERLRICARPQCRLAFHDATRSRTARWCSHVCGNRTNVAAHRARRAT